jgi:hypothetical protein
MSSGDNKNSNFNLFGAQKNVNQTIRQGNSVNSDPLSQEVLAVYETINNSKQHFKMDAALSKELDKAMDAIKRSAEVDPVDRTSLSVALKTILDILKSAAGSSLGAGLVVMVKTLLESLG